MPLYSLRRQHLYIAIFIGFIACLIRLGFVTFYPVAPLAGSDPTAFWSFAQGLAGGQGFRSTFEPWLADRPPLYSYFLAGVFLFFGESRPIIFTAQAVIGAIAASLYYLVGVRILGYKRGLVAGILFALLPHFLLFTQQILTEALYIPLLVVLLAVLLLPEQPGKGRGQWIWAGLVLGLVALVRREALLPAGLMGVGVAYLRLRPHWRQWVWAGAWVGAATVLTLTPWFVRNWQILGTPTLSSSGGFNFMVGNNPVAIGRYTPAPQEWMAQLEGLDELARNQKAWQLSLDWIKSQPGNFLGLLPRKFITLWEPAHNWVLDGADLVILLLGLAGLVRLSRRQPSWPMITVISLSLILSVTLISLVFVGGWRYRLAVYPGLLMLAAYGAPAIKLARFRQTFAGLTTLRAALPDVNDH